MDDPWPLRHLVLRTPRLELRPDDDAGLLELAEEARLGVHPPELMPFVTPWSDAPPEERALSTLQWHWQRRAEMTPARWNVDFLVRFDARVVGTQELAAADFAVTREVSTGSWLGLRHQGRRIGTEMRAAVLMLPSSTTSARRGRVPRRSSTTRPRCGCRRSSATARTAPKPSSAAAWPPTTSGGS